VQSCIVIEELARVDPAISVIVDIQNTLINTSIMKYGSEALKEKWLPRLATDTLGSFCLSEATSGSDAFAMKTTAAEQPDGTFRINGSKMWISNAKEAGACSERSSGQRKPDNGRSDCGRAHARTSHQHAPVPPILIGASALAVTSAA
jgi:alkylation response protein AidB-like acyl-CoA dehydrogenase